MYRSDGEGYKTHTKEIGKNAVRELFPSDQSSESHPKKKTLLVRHLERTCSVFFFRMSLSMAVLESSERNELCAREMTVEMETTSTTRHLLLDIADLNEHQTLIYF